MTPNGVSIGRPPALTAPPALVWQTAQLPSAASWAPRAIVAALKTEASGRAIGAMARHGNSAMPTPIAAVHSATMLANAPRRLANGLQLSRVGASVDAGAGRAPEAATSSPCSPFRIRSGVNGGSRKRTAVASKRALAIADA